MQRVEELPRNWTRAEKDWRWTPPKEERPAPAQVAVQQVQMHSSPAEANTRMLRTRPSLDRWREYWTDGERLDCGGWTLRAVQGFREEE